MPSDAAKKKAAQKKAAAVTKRAPAGKKDAAETDSQLGGPENEQKSSNLSSSGPASSETEPPRSGVSTESVPSNVAQTKFGVASNATKMGAANVSRVVFPPTLSAKQRALIHEVAESAGWNHASAGPTEDTRKLALWRDAEGDHLEVPETEPFFRDSDIADILKRVLHVSVKDQFPEEKKVDRKVDVKRGGGAKGSKSGTGIEATGRTISLDGFVSTMMPLIELEKNAEVEASTEVNTLLKPETAQKRGKALLNLKCTDAQSGLLGKTLLVLEPNRGDLFPPHKFTPHDVVALKLNKADGTSPALGQGVVYRVKDSAITVAFEDVPEDGLDSPLRIEKLTNEVTFRRLKETLIELSKGPKGPAVDLVPVLFGERGPRFAKKALPFTPINANLDHSQREAVSRALGAEDFLLLHGPPGTGKTTAVIELILQEVKKGRKILACAASNIAVDNMVERLAKHKVKLVRLGHPARLLPQVLDSALDALVMRTDNSSLANDVRKEMKQIGNKLLKTKDRREKGDLRRELKKLAKEERQRQQQAVTDVMKDSTVILTTLTGALSFQLKGTDFDLVVLDEAAQALECACWIPILKGRRCILAGDHLQLPPTVQSAEAEKKGLGTTMFERLTKLYGDEVTALLTVQYRMNESIMRWSSEELYNGKITAHESVSSHGLCDLEGVTSSPSTDPVLIMIDTAGCDMDELKEEEGGSTSNEGEARVVLSHVRRLLEGGVSAADIGVITPYSAQVGILKQMRGEDRKLRDLEISTVDGFQGREKEAVVISMVRSNDKGEVGFLADSRRMNVAVTRARRQCAVVCDSETVSNDPFLKRMVKYFEDNGEYLSAMEFT